MVLRISKRLTSTVAAAGVGVLCAVSLAVPAQAATGSFDYWSSGKKITVDLDHRRCYPAEGGAYAVNNTDAIIELNSSPNCGHDPGSVYALAPGKGAPARFESVEVF